MQRARRNSATVSLPIVAAGRSGGVMPWRNCWKLQIDYQAWIDALPENLAVSATAYALHEICDLDLSELTSVEPPRGFGRD